MHKVIHIADDYIKSLGFTVTDGIAEILLFSLLLLFLAALLFLTVLLSRFRRNYLARWKTTFDEALEPLILDLLYGNYQVFDDWWKLPGVVKFERRYLRKKRGRNRAIETLSILRSRLEGENASLLSEVFRKTGLWRDSIRRIKSRLWYRQAQGIKELGEFNYVEAVPQIRRLSDHPQEEVRSLAQLALIQLDDSDPFSFLDDLRNPISRHTTIRLHAAMLQKPSLELTTFARWLNSRHPDVVLFVTRMAGLFNAAADEPLLAKLVLHENEEIAKAAILSLEQLGAQEALTKKIPLLDKGNPEILTQLISSLGQLGYSNQRQLRHWLWSKEYAIAHQAFQLLLLTEEEDKLLRLAADMPDDCAFPEIARQRTLFNKLATR